MITATQLEAAGYRHSVCRGSKQFTDVLYQKRFDDCYGKRYFVNVWEWDNRSHQQKCPTMPDFSYQADGQFVDAQHRTFNVELLTNESIERIEDFFKTVWSTLGCQYYERFGEN